MMVGEHDWYLDMGEKWRELFGAPTYSFDHKGVHFVVLKSVLEKDFWTARGLTPMERMKTVAGLDNGVQSPLRGGRRAARSGCSRTWRRWTRRRRSSSSRHSPLYKFYKPWNFWTDDADEVQAILKPFENGDRHPRPHAPAADQPHRQHPLPRHAVDRVAVAVRAGGPAGAHRADEPRRSVQPVRRLRRRPGGRARRPGWSTRSTTCGTATRSPCARATSRPTARRMCPPAPSSPATRRGRPP